MMRSHVVIMTILVFCFSSTTAHGQTVAWQQTNGPRDNGGVILALAMDSSGNLFAGTDNATGGLLRSADDGESWVKSVNGLNLSQVYTIATAPDGHLFLGMADRGVYRSNDNGSHWEETSTDSPATGVRSFAFSPTGETFAATQGGIFRSTDDGAIWSRSDAGIPNPRMSCLARSSTGYLFGGTESSGVFRSTDDGATWTATSISTGFIICMGIDATGKIYIGRPFGGVLLSTDNGSSWSPANNGLTTLDTQGFAFDQNGTVYAGTLGGVYRSTDGGARWTEQNNGLSMKYLHTLLIARQHRPDTSNTCVYAGTDHGGLYRSLDSGESWVVVGVPAGVRTTKVAASVPSNIFAATYLSGLFRSSNNGMTWLKCIPPSTLGDEAFALKTNKAGHVFVGTHGHGAFRSTDNGATWVPINNGLTNPTVRDFVFTPGGEVFTCASENTGIFRSTDNGDTWSLINQGLTDRDVACLAVTNSNHLLAGVAGLSKLFRSTDNGDTWSVSNTGLPSYQVLHLVVSANGFVYADTPSGWYRSTNDGVTWHQPGAGQFYARSIVANSRNQLFSNGYTVYTSTDNGVNWVGASNGLWGEVHCLALNGNDWLYAGTELQGVFRTVGPTVSCDPFPSDRPEACLLNQNYPNPFNPATTIRYGVPTRSQVSLTVISTLGQQVATLVQGEKEAGYHEVKFDASALSSGVYFYRLSAGTYVETRKLLILR